MAMKTSVALIFMVNLVFVDMLVEGEKDFDNSINGKQCNIIIEIWQLRIMVLQENYNGIYSLTNFNVF